MTNIIAATALTASLLLNRPSCPVNIAGSAGQLIQESVLASESMDLTKRYPQKSINDGFVENIFTALGYFSLKGKISQANEGEFSFSIVLNPNDVFAFHKNILPQLNGSNIITQDSGFLRSDGYKIIAGLDGNGVCHLASLMNFVASEANLEVTAPTNHNFAQIQGIDRKYGTSIYYLPKGGEVSQRQNLYVRNNKDYPIEFSFLLSGNFLTFSISGVN